MGQRLDSMILEVFSNPNYSVISVKNEPLVRGQGEKPMLTRNKCSFLSVYNMVHLG